MQTISKQTLNKSWQLQDEARKTLLKQIEQAITDEQPWRHVSHHNDHLTLWLDESHQYQFDVYGIEHSSTFTCDLIDMEDHTQDVYSFAICVTAVSIVKQLNILIKTVGHYDDWSYSAFMIQQATQDVIDDTTNKKLSEF